MAHHRGKSSLVAIMQEHEAERRRWPRIDVRVAAAATPDGRAPIDCLITDINGYGARIEFGADAPPELFYLIDVRSGLGYLSSIAWRAGSLVGVRFSECWDLDTDYAPQWLKQIRKNLLRSYGEQRGLSIVSSTAAPTTPRWSWEPPSAA